MPPDQKERALLYYALFQDQRKYILDWLDTQPDVNESIFAGQAVIALHVATLGEHSELCQILLDRGADNTKENPNGKTAIDIALERFIALERLELNSKKAISVVDTILSSNHYKITCNNHKSVVKFKNKSVINLPECIWHKLQFLKIDENNFYDSDLGCKIYDRINDYAFFYIPP